MRYIHEDDALIIKSYCNNPEQGAIDQALNLARLPFAFKQIVMLPDAHQGYGMPIGTVLATNDVIIPNAVGKDKGCGMCAMKTNLMEMPQSVLRKIMSDIREAIPMGVGKQHANRDVGGMPATSAFGEIVKREYSRAELQMGTLGSGNHFIEIQQDQDGYIWIMLHSGSRNLGSQVADHYNKIAVAMNKKYHSSVPEKWDLAFLPVDSQEGQDYIEEMQYCVLFAKFNRKAMMCKIRTIFEKYFEPCISFEPMIDVAHNYARLENHFGKNVWVHRKGATSAKEGEIGIIPGSQGSCSYIVKGKGNKESFESCSHGAGRKMGRKEAQRTLNLEKEMKHLDDMNVLHSVRNTQNLEEAAGAYKDIDVVMQEQADLVDIVTTLRPLAVMKG